MEPSEESRLLQISENEGRSNSAMLEKPEDRHLVKKAILRLKEEVAESKKQSPLPTSLNAQIQEIERLEVAIAPHKALSPDIWTNVFQLTISNSGEFFEGSGEVLGTSHITEYNPWIIGQVCSAWRNLVRNSPLLWNRIAIEVSLRADRCDYFPEDGDEVDNNHPGMIEWARIVQNINSLAPATGPLSIAIAGSSMSNSMFGGGGSFLSTPIGVTYLQEHGSRLVNLNIRWCDPSQLRRLLRLPIATFPVLEGLSINYGWISPEIICDNTEIFTIPTLRRVAVYGRFPALRAILEIPAIPWNQYKDVTIYQETEDIFPGRIDSEFAINLLPRLHNVTHLFAKLDLAHVIKLSPSDVPPITFPSLKSLHLNTGDVTLLDFFIAPSLISLELIRSPSREDTEIFASTVDLIRRSGCSLRVFHEVPGARKFLGRPVGEHPEFLELFDLLPDVREVKFNGIVLGDEEVRRIGTYELFPHACVFDFPCEVPYKQVLEMLHERLVHENRPLGRLRARSRVDSPSYLKAKQITADYEKNYGVHVDLYY